MLVLRAWHAGLGQEQAWGVAGGTSWGMQDLRSQHLKRDPRGSRAPQRWMLRGWGETEVTWEKVKVWVESKTPISCGVLGE